MQQQQLAPLPLQIVDHSTGAVNGVPSVGPQGPRSGLLELLADGRLQLLAVTDEPQAEESGPVEPGVRPARLGAALAPVAFGEICSEICDPSRSSGPHPEAMGWSRVIGAVCDFWRVLGRRAGLALLVRSTHELQSDTDGQHLHPATAKRCHSPGTPLSSCSPRSSNSMPDPATKSFTVEETTTSRAPAMADTRCPR
jgi:hypothetical protein